MSCMICHVTGPTKYYNIYVIGSEGLRVCANCEVEYADLIAAKDHNGIYAVMMKKLGERKQAYIQSRLATGELIQYVDESGVTRIRRVS